MTYNVFGGTLNLVQLHIRVTAVSMDSKPFEFRKGFDDIIG